METVEIQLIKDLKKKNGRVTDRHLSYLQREKSFYDTSEKREFLDALRSAVEFANVNKLCLGPGRGPSSSSLLLYSIGFTNSDPTKHDLLPERMLKDSPDIHIDVQFEGGQKFVDYCRHLTRGLTYGKINAFKMPLLDIIKSVDSKVGGIDFDQIDCDNPLVLQHFRTGDLKNIFNFDASSEPIHSQLFSFEKSFDGMTLEKYVLSQEIGSFRDLYNILAVWRTNTAELRQRVLKYLDAKNNGFEYSFLSPRIKEQLKLSYGRALYQEDFIRIVSEYTGWSFQESNQFRYGIAPNVGKRFPTYDYAAKLEEFNQKAPAKVVELFFNEAPYSFCYSHLVSFMDLVKKTAILKSLHNDVYQDEINRFEDNNDFAWDDYGFQTRGVSILQN